MIVRCFLASGFAISCIGVAIASAPDGVSQELVQTDLGSVDCDQHETCLIAWRKLPAEEQARIWPTLNRHSQIRIWGDMSPKERALLRQHLRPVDRLVIRNRFVTSKEQINSQSAVDPDNGTLCRDDRHLLRRQIIEVHLELQDGQPMPNRSGLCSPVEHKELKID